MSYKSNYTGEQIDKVIGDNLEVNIKDLKRELDDAKDIVVYQMPSNWDEVGKQYQITQDNFHDIFGSEDELLKNLENKHVRLKIFGTDEIAKMTIDVTTSLQVKFPSLTSVTYIINFNGIASNDVEDFLTVYALDVRCGIGIDKLTDGTYSLVGGSFEIIKKETVTTEEIADWAVTAEKIAPNAVNSFKIASGAVTNEKIADSAITTSKIRYAAVTNEKIADGAITKDKIADGVIKSIDEVITADSTNPISSGAVYNAIYSVLNTEV